MSVPAQRIDTSTLPGWGFDADPENDPTFPMRDRSDNSSAGRDWTPPGAQVSQVEILQSVEHTRRPAVFGTASPPRGVSGVLRRMAFGYSESQWAHWMILMAADRVDMIEGVAEDLVRGKVPNLYEEMGLGAEMKHNRDAFIQRITVAGAVAAISAGLVLARSNRRRRARYGHRR